MTQKIISKLAYKAVEIINYKQQENRMKKYVDKTSRPVKHQKKSNISVTYLVLD